MFVVLYRVCIRQPKKGADQFLLCLYRHVPHTKPMYLTDLGGQQLTMLLVFRRNEFNNLIVHRRHLHERTAQK
jgi:hypothetical protein